MAPESAGQQLPLFHSKGQAETRPLSLPTFVLSSQSSLTAAISAFHDYMARQGFSANTIKAFGGDLAIFMKYSGAARPVGELSTQHLHEFLTFLRVYRGVPCNPKSYQRRLTTLKVFFNFLFQQRAIPRDPAVTIAHQPAVSPLPDILYADQVNRLLEMSRRLRDADKSDVRPYLIVSIVLATGIKKSELMAIRIKDLELAHPSQPILYVRYEDPRRQHKERKLKLPPDLPQSLAFYQKQYQIQDQLFECTSRNLEYVLADLARQAGLENPVSFETLRWTCAVRDYTGGMREETLRQKLGLSTVTWPEVIDKIKRLAAAPL